MAVAAAQTASPYYYKQYSYTKPVERSAEPAAPAAYAPAPVAQAYATAPVVQASSYSKGSGDVDFATLLTDFGTIAELINDPYYALEKSQALLEDLNNDLPEALAKMDPAIKDDIKQVNALILEICDKAVANIRPSSTTSYYSPQAMKATCGFLNKHVPTISRGMDDPAVITNIIEKLGKFGRLSKQMADLFE